MLNNNQDVTIEEFLECVNSFLLVFDFGNSIDEEPNPGPTVINEYSVVVMSLLESNRSPHTFHDNQSLVLIDQANSQLSVASNLAQDLAVCPTTSTPRDKRGLINI